jgi:hypothetical protein
MKKGILTIFVLLLALGIAIYGFNYIQLQSKMNSVLKADPRNEGIKVTVHFGAYVNPSKLIYNLKSVSATNSMADVFRVFLQFAEKMCSKDFKEVVLAHKGTAKFKIDGDYFQKLGKEYSWQNPVYTMRTFPENLKNLDGSQAYGQWTGGLLGVLKEQMEDFNDFHRKWYLDDMTK